MHEYGIARALVTRVCVESEARGGLRVTMVWVRIGELAGVEPDLLAKAFAACRAGSACSAASLEIQRVPAIWSCPRCGVQIATGGPLRCDACGAPSALSQGGEMILERVEMEVDDV